MKARQLIKELSFIASLQLDESTFTVEANETQAYMFWEN